jgi:hypothetical protein
VGAVRAGGAVGAVRAGGAVVRLVDHGDVRPARGRGAAGRDRAGFGAYGGRVSSRVIKMGAT